MLTSIICLPFLAALVILAIPGNYRFVIRCVALLATLLTAVLAICLFIRFDDSLLGWIPPSSGYALLHGNYQFAQLVEWVPSLGISYHVGVDGINVGLILMGAIVAFAAACVSWEIRRHEKQFYFLLLMMTGGILGAFASLDLFFFYAFHELALVPTFIMIGVWGGGENKNYATFKITLYLSIGALIALAGLIGLYLQVPPEARRTFDLVELTRRFQDGSMPVPAQNVIFPLLMFGFGILVSLWPFHTWAPLGYGAAPTATAMLHSGVLKKFGLYGLIRVALPMMPEGARMWVPALAWLCLGNILYCGWVAMRQRDLNLLIGNSSVAHIGFCFLGIASLSLIGVTGAVVVMIAHGLLAALTFGLSGYLAQQTGTVNIDQLGGLLRKLPFIGTALVMAMLAGCGVPGFANFAGELLVLFGAFKTAAFGHAQWFVVIAAWGALIVGAVYMLRAVRDVLHGPMSDKWAGVKDATVWRKVPFALLLAGLLLFGIFPSLLTNKIKPSAESIVKMATASRDDPGRAAAIIKERFASTKLSSLFGPVTVTVISNDRFFYVGGEVGQPNRFLFETNLTVSEAIRRAGGLTRFANFRRVQLARVNGEKISIDMSRVKVTPELNLDLRPGDVVLVARRFF